MLLLAAWDVVMLHAAAVAAVCCSCRCCVLQLSLLRAAAVAAACCSCCCHSSCYVQCVNAAHCSGHQWPADHCARMANTSPHQNGVRVLMPLATSGAWWQAQRASWCSNGSLVMTQHSRGILQVRFRQPKVFGTIMTNPTHQILPGTTTTVAMCQNLLNFKFGRPVYDDGFRW